MANSGTGRPWPWQYMERDVGQPNTPVRVQGSRDPHGSGFTANKEQQLCPPPTPPFMAPLLESSPSPFAGSPWPVVIASPSASLTPSFSRPWTRKVARIAARATHVIDPGSAVQGASPASWSDLGTGHSRQLGFSPNSIGGSPPLREQCELLETTLEPSDVRSLSYYQHLPIKLEDLLSDTDSSFEGVAGLGEAGEEESIDKLHVAEEFHRVYLLRRAMRVLVRNALVKREVAKMGVWHHQQWKLQLLFQKWRKVAITRGNRRLQMAFSLWRTRTAVCLRLTEVVRARNREALVHCFGLWRVSVAERKAAHHHYRSHLKRKAFRRWRDVTISARQRLQSAAVAFHQTRTLEKAFLIWRAVVLCRLESRESGGHLLQRAYLRGRFHRWRDFVHARKHQRDLAMSLTSATDGRQLRRSLTLWRQELRQREKSELAKKALAHRLKRMGFQAWRQYIYHRTLKQLCEAYLSQQNTSLLQVSFNQWVWQTAAVVGESLLSSRLSLAQRSSTLHAAFAGWREVTRLSRGVRRIRSLHERGALTWSFQVWKRLLQRVQHLKSKCVVLESWRTRQIFRQWRSHLLHRQQELAAVNYHNTRTLQAAFVFWKAEDDRQKALCAFLVSRQSSWLNATFDKWKSACSHRQELSRVTTAIQFNSHGALRRCLVAWQIYARESVEESNKNVSAAVGRLEKLKVSLLLSVWRRQVYCCEVARLCVAKRSHKILLKCFYSWKEMTLGANKHASILFMAKLQSALSEGDFCSGSAEIFSLLASVSSNLGLDPSPFHSGSSTTYGFSYIYMLRSLSQQIQRSLDASSAVLGASRLPYSSPALASNSTDSPLRLKDLSPSSEMKPVRRRLFGTEPEGTESGDTPTHSQSPAALTDGSPVDSQSSESPTMLSPRGKYHVDSIQTGGANHGVESADVTDFEWTHKQEDSSISTCSILDPPAQFSSPLHQHPAAGTPPCTPDNGSGLYHSFSQPLDLALAGLPMPKPIQTLCDSVRYMRLFPCSKAFHAWKEYLTRRKSTRELGQVLEGRHRMRAVRKVFYPWKELGLKLLHLRELEAILLRKTEAGTLRTSFKVWRTAVQKRTADGKAKVAAVEFHESLCLRRHFLLWRKAFHTCRANDDKHQLVERAVLQRVFTCWKRGTELRQRTRKFLIRWKHTAKARKQSKQAETVCNYWTLSCAWGKWRVEYIREMVTSRIARKSDRELLKHAFSSWRSAVTVG